MSVRVICGDTAEARLTLAQSLMRKQPSRSVYSNISLSSPADGTVTGRYESLGDLADVKDAFIVVADAADWFPSFTDRATVSSVFSLLAGSRLNGTTWLLLVPSFESLDVNLRQLVNFIHECRPLFPCLERFLGAWHCAELLSPIDRNVPLGSRLFRTESFSCPSM